MKKQITLLKKEIEKTRSQFYLFWELTKAMRSTLRFDEIIYIILTGLTADQGLGFNRAILFITDPEKKQIKGFMGIGPMDHSEADQIWQHIRREKKDLYDLINAYHHIKEGKITSKFMSFIQKISLPLDKSSGLIFDVLSHKVPLHIKQDRKDMTDLKKDPLIKKIKLNEFIIAPLWLNKSPTGIIIVDNSITKRPLTNEDVRMFTLLMEQAEIAIENSQAFEDTLAKAHTDHLTSLWNYGYFHYKLDDEIKKTEMEKTMLCLMMIDVDDFKLFNDAKGHLSGDNALKELSSVLKSTCRRTDILCRYGGEEFSLILPATTKKQALRLGERIRKAIQKTAILDNNFTVSIGISSFPHDATEKIKLINKADNALYQAKAKGKDCIILA